MRFSRLVPLVLVALGLFFTPADAQYITPNTAGSAGGACTNGTYTWPDSSGYVLKCTSSVWARVSEGGTADYNGTGCQSGYFLAGLDDNFQAICRQPTIYTT